MLSHSFLSLFGECSSVIVPLSLACTRCASCSPQRGSDSGASPPASRTSSTPSTSGASHPPREGNPAVASAGVHVETALAAMRWALAQGKSGEDVSRFVDGIARDLHAVDMMSSSLRRRFGTLADAQGRAAASTTVLMRSTEASGKPDDKEKVRLVANDGVAPASAVHFAQL